MASPLDNMTDQEFLRSTDAAVNPMKPSVKGNPLYSQSPAQIEQTTSLYKPLDDMTDEEFLRSTDAAVNPDKDKKPSSSFVGGIEYFQYLARSFPRGAEIFGVTDLAGKRTLGLIDDQEYWKQRDQLAASSLAKEITDTEAALGGLANPLTWPSVVLQTLPASGATILGGAVGAVGGGTLGGVAGFVATPTPDPATRSIGALVGASSGVVIGNRIGAGTAAAYLEFGDAYTAFRDAGLSHEASIPGAVGAGVINGAVEMVGLEVLYKVAQRYAKLGRKFASEQVYKNVFTSEVQGSLVNMAKDFAGTALFEGSTEFFQQLVQNAALLISAKVSGEVLQDPPNFRASLVDSFLRGMIGGGGQQILFAAAGATLGAVTAKDTSTEEALRLIRRSKEEIEQELQAEDAAQLEVKGEIISTVRTAQKIETERQLEFLAAEAEKVGEEHGKVLKQRVHETKEKQIKTLVSKRLDKVAEELTEAQQKLKEAKQKAKEQEKSELSEKAQIKLNALRQERDLLNEVLFKEEGKKFTSEQASQLRKSKIVTVPIEKVDLTSARDKALTRFKLINKELDVLEEKMAIGENEDFDSLQDKAQRLDQEQDLLNRFLESDALKDVDIDALKTALSARRVDSLLKFVQKQLTAGIKQAIQETQSITKATVKAIRQLIQKSGLPQERQGVFLSAIENNLKPGKALVNLDKLFAKLDEQLERSDRAAAIKKLNRIIKRTRIPKGGKGSLDTAQRQRVLSLYKELLSNPDKAKQITQTLLERQMADDILSEQESEALIVASDAIVYDLNKSAKFTEKASESINKLADKIESIRKEGREVRLEENRVKQEERNLLTEKVSELGKFGKISTTDSKAVKEQLDSSLLGVLKKGEWGIATWDHLWHTILQRSSAAEIEHLLDMDVGIIKSIAEAYQLIKDTTITAAKTIADTAFEGKLSKLNNYIAKGRLPNLALSWINQDGVTVTEKMSRNEALQFLGWMNDKDARAGMVAENRFTFDTAQEGERSVISGHSTESVLRNVVGETGLKVLDGLAKFYDEQFPEVQKKFEDKYKVPLEKVDTFYGSLIRQEEKQDIQDDYTDFLASMFEIASLRPTSVRSRTNNTRGVKATDLFSNLERYIQTTRNWIAKDEQAVKLKHLLSDKQFRKSVEKDFGLQATKVLDKFLNDYIRGDYLLYNNADKIAGGLTGNIYSLALNKPDQFLKQLTSVGNTLLYISVDEFIDGLTDFWSNPSSAIKYVNQHILIAMRAEIFDKEIVAATQNAEARGIVINIGSKKVALKKIWTLALAMGDKLAAAQTAYVIAKAYRKRGFSEKAALEKGAELANRIMGSGTVDQLGDFARSGGFARAFSIFTQPANQLFLHEVKNYRQLWNHPSFDNATKALLTLASVHVGEMLFNTIGPAFLAGWTGDDEERKKAVDKILDKGSIGLVLGAASGITLLGSVLSSLGAIVTKRTFDLKTRIYKPEFIISENLGEFVDVAQSLVKVGKELQTSRGEVTPKVQEEMLKAAQAVLYVYELFPQLAGFRALRYGGAIPFHAALDPKIWIKKENKGPSI